MSVLKRIKNAAKAFREPTEISTEELKKVLAYEPIGDGNAEFLPDMTEEEYQTYIRDEEQGWGKFRKKLGL